MTTRPLILDLFCGGGGAAMGYHRAGFNVVGVDINRQPNYPFRFWQGDAMAGLQALLDGHPVIGFDRDWRLRDLAAIHASPPCQVFTRKSHDWGRKRTYEYEHIDLLTPIRPLLEASGLPYVIENVMEAPMRRDLWLCGTMFRPETNIQKHRQFEANWPLPPAPPHGDHAGTYNPWQGKGRSAAKLREAMDIDWLPISGGASRKLGYTGDLFNAIPPAYTEHIGKALIEVIQ